MHDQRTRRDVLKFASTAGVVALAGCTTGANTGSTPTEDGHGHEDAHSHETETQTHHDHGGHSHESVEGPEASAEVRMITTGTGTHFDPHVVWVEEGATVTWINESGSHTTTAYTDPRRIPEDADGWDSGMLTEAGATFEVTFDTPGVYDYYCTPHVTTGMIGSVIVGEPDPHDQPGLAEPQSSMAGTEREKIHGLNEQVNEALGHTHAESTPTEGTHHEAGATDGGHHEETTTESGHGH